MKEDSKCFIKIENGIYEEITYKELEKRRKLINDYKQKKFIYIHGMLLEVSKKEYKDYYVEIERNRYSKRVLQKLQAVSIEELNTDEDMDDKQVIVDESNDLEFEVERKIEVEQLKEALRQLNSNENKLVKALFFERKTTREYAQIMGISHVAIIHQKERILKKLKKILKF